MKIYIYLDIKFKFSARLRMKWNREILIGQK